MKYGKEDTSGMLKVSGSEVTITDGLSRAIYWTMVCRQRPSSFHDRNWISQSLLCIWLCIWLYKAFTSVLPLLLLLNVF